jgi:hypothetical protein
MKCIFVSRVDDQCLIIGDNRAVEFADMRLRFYVNASAVSVKSAGSKLVPACVKTLLYREMPIVNVLICGNRNLIFFATDERLLRDEYYDAVGFQNIASVILDGGVAGNVAE